MIQKIIGEDILFCIPLEPNTTGEKYLSTNKYDINQAKGVTLYSDGTKSITRYRSGLAVRLQEVMLSVTQLHCFLHPEALPSKPFEMDCYEKFHQSCKFYQWKSVMHSHFQKKKTLVLFYINLPYHIEVRWFSMDNVLKRVFRVKQEHIRLESRIWKTSFHFLLKYNMMNINYNMSFEQLSNYFPKKI